jgi:L-alanine-DL-glutamate epimerase-like enolase superfamily enzyme
MAITRVRLHRQFHPFRRSGYAMHYGSAPGEESFVVALEDDAGVTGFGEVAMLDGRYSEAFPGGVPAGIAHLAPALLGLDAAAPISVSEAMDQSLRGQEYIKTAVDIACWDALGKASGQPLHALLGGALVEGVPLYNVVTAGGSDADACALAQALLAEGYRRLQVKVGVDPHADAARLQRVRTEVGDDVVLYADANGGFTTGDARTFLRLTRELDFVLEQPCATYEECRAIRAFCARPLVLDESIGSLQALLRARDENVVDGITIKLGRVGGITPARLIRDAASELGVSVCIESTGGASLSTAAFIHLGVGLPHHRLAHTVDFQRWWTTDNGAGLPAAAAGMQAPPLGPGLGIDVDLTALGEPILDIAA